MPKEPLVSVVMCTYNGANFLSEQLESIVHQTHLSLEIIICDDASTDETWDILTTYAISDKRISLFRNEKNIGFAANFNKSCSLATGNYIAFADQDDIWHTDKIRRMMKNWPSESPLIYCNSVRFVGKQVPINAKANPLSRRFKGKDVQKLAIFNTISGHAMIVKKELVSLVFPLQNDLFYDWCAGIAAACNGGVSYLPEILVWQRIHENNVTIGKGFGHNDPKYHRWKFKKMVAVHLQHFISTPNMTINDMLFFKTLSTLWSSSLTKKISWPLFLFLLKKSKLIFWYKVKRVSFFSYIKHSYRLASSNVPKAISYPLI